VLHRKAGGACRPLRIVALFAAIAWAVALFGLASVSVHCFNCHYSNPYKQQYHWVLVSGEGLLVLWVLVAANTTFLVDYRHCFAALLAIFTSQYMSSLDYLVSMVNEFMISEYIDGAGAIAPLKWTIAGFILVCIMNAMLIASLAADVLDVSAAGATAAGQHGQRYFTHKYNGQGMQQVDAVSYP
jgi:hypothetical protein